jgi:hypothetical protein
VGTLTAFAARFGGAFRIVFEVARRIVAAFASGFAGQVVLRVLIGHEYLLILPWMYPSQSPLPFDGSGKILFN